MPSATSSTVRALVTPTDEPMLQGLMNSGRPSRAATVSAVCGPISCSASPSQRACSMPWWASTCFAMALSMASADPSTPLPTYGTSASSRRPWTVPSSPSGPCRSGSTTVRPSAWVADSTGAAEVAAPSTARPSVRAASAPEASSAIAPAASCQSPSRVMPTAVTR